MHIGLLAPPFETVPPARYGGTERVVAALADALLARGHEVTLFASGDSRTRARLVPTVEHAAWHDRRYRDPLPLCARAVGIAYAHAGELDVLHNHFDHHTLAAARLCRTPTITTLHGALDGPEYATLFDEFTELPLVSISMAQREPAARVHWIANVPHGYPLDLYQPTYEPGGYVAFCGRFSPDKGAHIAIEAARRAGLPIKLAGRRPEINERNEHSYAEKAYFDTVIQPRLDEPEVEYVGELREHEKQALYGGAIALLSPIAWREPFGLVMIEALACGTPVLACPEGSVPEIVEHGVTGFHCRSADDFATAIQRVHTLSRRRCRQAFERRFSAGRMAAAYEDAYRRLAPSLDQVPQAMQAPFPRRRTGNGLGRPTS